MRLDDSLHWDLDLNRLLGRRIRRHSICSPVTRTDRTRGYRGGGGRFGFPNGAGIHADEAVAHEDRCRSQGRGFEGLSERNRLRRQRKSGANNSFTPSRHSRPDTRSLFITRKRLREPGAYAALWSCHVGRRRSPSVTASLRACRAGVELWPAVSSVRLSS